MRLMELLAGFASTASGSSTRVTRVIVLDEPPSLDAGEVTDKGSLNQGATLLRRRSLVEDLYATAPPAHVMTCPANIGRSHL